MCLCLTCAPAPTNRRYQAEDELRGIQRKLGTVENDFDMAQEALQAAQASLEEKDKALTSVSTAPVARRPKVGRVGV